MKKFPLLCTLYFVLCTFAYTSNDLSNANFLAKESIVTPQTDVNQYRLDDTILRQEVIAMALKLKGVAIPENYTCKKYYSDMPKGGWVCSAIEIAADNGFISRENTRARPRDFVTKAEALAILLKTGKVSLSSPRRVPQSDGSVWSLYQDLRNLGFTQWQADMLDSLPNCLIINHGISCEDGASTNGSFSQFQPNTPALRSEVFEFAALISGFIARDDIGELLDDFTLFLRAQF